MVDKGLVKANDALDAANKEVPEQIKSAEKGHQYKVYADKSRCSWTNFKEGSQYIDGIKDYMIKESGGYEEVDGIQQLKAQRL